MRPANPRELLRRWLDRRAQSGCTVTLGYRQIFILPTRGGFAFAAMLLALWVGAVNYSNNMAFLLCFLLVGFALVAIIHTFRNLHGLTLTATPATALFSGDTAQFPITIGSAGSRSHHSLVLHSGRQSCGAVRVTPEDGATASVAVTANHRGVLHLPLVTAESTFPGGLFRAWSRARLDSDCIVYPTPEAGAVPPPENAQGNKWGRPSSAGDDDFTGLRPYQPADPLKRIHWRSLARGLELRTKQFSGAESGSAWFDYQATQGLPPEQRLSRLCRWILDADRTNSVYGLALPGVRIAPGSGATHRHRCLEALALFPERPA